MYTCAYSQLPAPDRQRKEHKQVAMKGVVRLGPNPFQQIKRLSFFLSLVKRCSALSSDYEVEFSVPEYCDRVVILFCKELLLTLIRCQHYRYLVRRSLVSGCNGVILFSSGVILQNYNLLIFYSARSTRSRLS